MLQDEGESRASFAGEALSRCCHASLVRIKGRGRAISMCRRIRNNVNVIGVPRSD